MPNKAASRRVALAGDYLDTVMTPIPSAPRRDAVAKPERIQLNVLFDSWETIDFLKAIAYIERKPQRAVIADALTAYVETLPAAARRDIRAHVETLTAARGKPGKPGRSWNKRQ